MDRQRYGLAQQRLTGIGDDQCNDKYRESIRQQFFQDITYGSNHGAIDLLWANRNRGVPRYLFAIMIQLTEL